MTRRLACFLAVVAAVAALALAGCGSYGNDAGTPAKASGPAATATPAATASSNRGSGY